VLIFANKKCLPDLKVRQAFLPVKAFPNRSQHIKKNFLNKHQHIISFAYSKPASTSAHHLCIRILKKQAL
jgi:hypothetical protein